MKRSAPRSVRESYGDLVTHAISTGDNPSGEKMSIRELARRIGLSYEQVRKIGLGFPVVSAESNAKLCKVLGLDEQRMWQRAMEEKFARRYDVSELPDKVPSTIGGKMGTLWPELSEEVRERVYRYAEMMHEEDLIQQRRQKRIGPSR